MNRKSDARDGRKLGMNVIAERLTSFSSAMSAEEKVSVGLCGSVANERAWEIISHGHTQTYTD